MMSALSPTLPRPRTQLALLSDSQLLQRFAGRADQAAFATLVQRHGPLVLGVCRRILQHDQDTEDAFQATFVVLARKAGGISNHQSLASWLYKVAYRIALRARSDKARRHLVENQAPPRAMDTDLGDVVQRELQQILGEEVQRLPEKYRAPILLCYLQGQTNEEAAAELRTVRPARSKSACCAAARCSASGSCNAGWHCRSRACWARPWWRWHGPPCRNPWHERPSKLPAAVQRRRCSGWPTGS